MHFLGERRVYFEKVFKRAASRTCHVFLSPVHLEGSSSQEAFFGNSASWCYLVFPEDSSSRYPRWLQKKILWDAACRYSTRNCSSRFFLEMPGVLGKQLQEGFFCSLISSFEPSRYPRRCSRRCSTPSSQFPPWDIWKVVSKKHSSFKRSSRELKMKNFCSSEQIFIACPRTNIDLLLRWDWSRRFFILVEASKVVLHESGAFRRIGLGPKWDQVPQRLPAENSFESKLFWREAQNLAKRTWVDFPADLSLLRRPKSSMNFLRYLEALPPFLLPYPSGQAKNF